MKINKKKLMERLTFLTLILFLPLLTASMSQDMSKFIKHFININ